MFQNKQQYIISPRALDVATTEWCSFSVNIDEYGLNHRESKKVTPVAAMVVDL